MIESIPRLKVVVTQAEINTAIPANSSHCMIADAVKRCYLAKFKRKPIGVSVDLQTIRLSDYETKKRYIWLTPSIGQRALLQFDQGISPTEFSFRLTKKNCQVVKSASRKEATPKQKDAAKKSAAKRKLLVETTKGKGHRSAGDCRTIVGGTAPPVGSLSGNRRQFGVKRAGDLTKPTSTVVV